LEVSQIKVEIEIDELDYGPFRPLSAVMTERLRQSNNPIAMCCPRSRSLAKTVVKGLPQEKKNS
jgi:hypothetical protein